MQHMNLLATTIFFSIIGGVLSLAGGAGLLVFRKKLDNIQDYMTSFAAGVLLSVAVLDLLPESFENGNTALIPLFVLGGILLLFVFEKTSVWFHHHHEPHSHAHPQLVGVFLGDTIHNFIDGVAIGSAFLIGNTVGITTAIAVAMHELPQEMADFSIYLKSGMASRKIFGLNLLSSLATVVGAALVIIFKSEFESMVYYFLAFTSGMFLYIALADLVPDLHVNKSRGICFDQLYIFFLGLIVSYLAMIALH
jgi:zinc and cadmium transporter